MERRADALFRVCDSVLSESQARSLPAISPSPFFERQWPRIDAALADGKIDVDTLRAVCVRSVLAELPAHAPVWIAGDATPEERPAAATSEDRGFIHVPNVPLADTPISMGWIFSVGGLLPEQASRWTPPRDIQRIGTAHTAVGIATLPLRHLTPLFGTRQVIVVADRASGTPDMVWACREWGDHVLIRLKSHRKLSRKPVRRFTPGRPPDDGPVVQGTRPETQGDPSEIGETTDQQGRETRVSRVDEVHVQHDHDLIVSVIRVERTGARGTRRDPRISWFLTLDQIVPLEQVPPRSGLRFSEEHLFRFLKQDVLWLAARVRTPEPFLRWSWMVSLAFLQVSLAREVGLHALLHPIIPGFTIH